mgnify:CR=1 FL=1
MYYKKSCPVPQDQRPLTEYLLLVQSSFSKKIISNTNAYYFQLIKLGLWFFAFGLIIAILSIGHFRYKILLLDFMFTILLLMFVILRLFLSWKYVSDRLYQPTIPYEESGWYDGKIWLKPKSILLQDRLIYEYKIIPVFDRIYQSSFILTIAFMTTIIILLLL